MEGIRGQLRSGGAAREQQWMREARRSVPPHLATSTARLRANMAAVRSAIARIGVPPPAPPTFRARLGTAIIAFLRRVLFWFTPSIQQADNSLADVLDKHLKITEELIAVLEKTNVELARLKQSGAASGSAIMSTATE